MFNTYLFICILFIFFVICVASAFYILATIIEGLGFSTVHVTSGFCVFIQGLLFLAGHAATFSLLEFTILGEMLVYLAICVASAFYLLIQGFYILTATIVVDL